MDSKELFVGGKSNERLSTVDVTNMRAPSTASFLHIDRVAWLNLWVLDATVFSENNMALSLKFRKEIFFV
jgi:hypothetical protein